ncbi:MAG: glycoside hydrolase family 140 protein [candidate division KSB1 bacterium]|nr:glycoside hydrolase family 140 protein [candidate division KSB1 bacterium]
MRVCSVLVVLIEIGSLFSQPIVVSKNNRFLQTSSGQPFFWLGDTAWELFHRLNRQEAERYLENRAEKGFNVIQAVVLPELEGLEQPNAYGDFPLKGHDITKLDTTAGHDPTSTQEYDYWDHVEWIIQKAAEKHLIMGVLPCWGEYVIPRFWERIIGTPQQGYDYGWFIGNRLKHWNNHIIWILGGDRLPDERENGADVWRAMAEGITDAIAGVRQFDHRATFSKTFMTYHCYRSSSTWFHHDDWIDMHTWGSYHEQRDNERAYFEAYHDWNLPNPKPTLNSEPAYELLPINYHWEDAALGYFDDFDVRQIAYWSVFSGTCGHTYGCHPVWQMYKKEHPIPPLTNTVHKQWFEALDEPGAFQMGYLKKLMLSRPFFSRIPNQQVIVENPYDPIGYLTACSGDGYLMVYIPTGKAVRIYTGLLKANRIKIWWFNPRTGQAHLEGEKENQAKMEFDPPGETMRGNDWVLVIDDASREFSMPGSPTQGIR